MLMAALTAMPLPAAPSPATPVKSTRKHTRYRGGVPTFADSTSTDDGAYDDPVVRAAAVAALGATTVRWWRWTRTPGESSR